MSDIPWCHGRKYEEHRPTEMYETEEGWRCPGCRTVISFGGPDDE